MATFEKESWLWVPDPVECFLPAKVNGSFNQGSAGSVTYENGTAKDLSAAESKDCLQMDEQSLGILENMVHFNDLKDAVLLHNLRKRFVNDQVYTSVGTILVAVNPFKLLPIYTPEVLQTYMGGSDTSTPHCWSIGAAAYRALVSEQTSQAVCISGESGAGKTESMKLILQCLAECSQKSSGSAVGSDTKSIEQLILQSNPVTEGFGNAKTLRNNNSSRFGKWTALAFNNQGSISGGYIVPYLLEKSRVVFQTAGERNYHSFYQMLAGTGNDSNLAADLGMETMDKYNYLNQSGTSNVDGIDDEKDFTQMMDALTTLGITVDEQNAILRVLASILHTGNLQFQNKSELEEGAAVSNVVDLEEVVRLLRVDHELLQDGLTSKNIGTRSVILIPFTLEQAADARDAFAKATYGKLFDWLIKKINVSLAQNIGGSFESVKDQKLIGVLDIFGFESFETNSFEQLCINYCNEKLQFHFNNYIFTLEQDEYKAEGVDVSMVTFKSNGPTLELIEKKGEGLLAMLDEEIVVPKGSDAGFLSKVLQKHAKHEALARPKPKELNAQLCFKIVHYAGEVSYNTTNFLEKNKDALLDGLESLAKQSDDDFVKSLFKEEVDAGEQTAKKKTAVRRKTGRKKVATLAFKFKTQLDALMETINACEPHFIRCMKPNAEKKGGIFTASMMMEQLRCAGVLEVCRIRQVGFPMRRQFRPFLLRYAPMVPGSHGDGADGCKKVCEALVSKKVLKDGDFALGKSKVFLRAAAQLALDEARAKSLEKFVVMMQCAARRKIVSLRYKLWLQTVQGLRTSSKERNLSGLEKWIGLSTNLPYRGEHLADVKTAKGLVTQLGEEQRFVQALRAAMEEGELSNLQSLVESAASMPGFEAPELEEARGVILNLKKQVQVRELLNAAVASKDKVKLDEALTEAEEIGLDGSNEYEIAKALLETIEEQETILQELQDAVETKNLKNLNALLTSIIDLGMSEDHAIVVRAKTMQTELKGAQESKYLLKKAISVAESTRQSEDLEAALKKAKDAGTDEQSEEVTTASTLLAALKKEVAVRTNLKDATAARDQAKLEAALEEVKAIGLKGSADLVAEARATLARIQNEAAVRKELHDAVGTKNVAKLQAALAKAANLWPSTEGVPEVAAEIEKGTALLQTLGSKNNAMDAVITAMGAAETTCGVAELKMLTTTLEAAAEAGMGADEQYAKAKDLEGILTKRISAEADLRNVMSTPADDSEQRLEQALTAAADLGLSIQNSETVRQARGALQMLQRRASVAPILLQKGENPTQALSDAVAAKNPDAISLAIMLVLRKGTDESDPAVVQAKLVMNNLVEAKEVQAQLQAIVSTYTAGRVVSSETQTALFSALKRAEAANMESPVVGEARAVLEKGEKSTLVMDKLKQAIKSKNMTQLDNAITAAAELGIPADNFQLSSARSMLQSVYVSTKLDTDLEDAMKNENLTALQKLVVEATKMGLSNDHPKVKQAKVLADALLARQKVSIQVTSALNSQNQDLMQSALTKAEQVGLKTQTVTQLRQMVSGAGDIDQLLKNLSKAVETRDLSTLTRLYAEAEDLGLHDDVVTDALVMKERLELVQELTASLERATANVQSSPTRANHHELMELVARAMQCNLQSPFLQVARSAAEKAEKQLELFEGVHAAVVASELARSRMSGIIARDIAHLQAAIQSVGSAEFADALKEPTALLEQMRKQLAVQKSLAEGINSQELSQLQSALQAASQIGLEITLVQEARRAVASLEGVRAKGMGVLAELKRAKPNAEVAEEWKNKLKIADQIQFHFSKYDQVRVPADFVIGVKKNRKRVQMQMLSFQAEPLHKSITFLESELNAQARNIHRNILGFCSDLIMSFPLTLAVDILGKGLEVPALCDEIYAQLCKQLTSNPTPKSTLRGWQLMCFCLHTFPPSQSFEVYLLNFLLSNEKDTKQGSTRVLQALRSNAGISGLVEYCLKKMEIIVRDGPADKVPDADQLDGLLPKKVQKAIRRGSMLVRQKQQEAYVVEEEVKLATNVVGSERAESVQKELEEARGIFRTLLATDTTHRTLHFDQVLHCPDVAQQIAKSDLSVDAVKGLWDMACVDPASGGNNTMVSLGDRVGFIGFLRFLDLCEQDGDVGVARAHGLAGRFGEGLAALKTSLLPNMRSTLTKHHRAQTGDVKGCGPPSNELDKLMHRALLGRSLETRQDKETLRSRGIIKNVSNAGAALDTKMKKMMLGKALAGRPERASLTAQGILEGQTGTQKMLQQNLRKSMLGQALSNRPERQSLVADGIVIDSSSAQQDLQKNLNASMLNRRFSQRPALEQLEQMGIYRNATSEKIDMERQLISSQLNKTLGRRLSKQADSEGQEEGKVMEEDILAIVFEQLADNTSLLSFSKLQAWDEVQSQMRSKQISDGELSKVFHDCDGDQDGKITFSEFLLLLKALEERQKAKAPPARRKSLMSIKRRGTLLENAASVGRCESLKGILLKKMASRPEVEQLRNKGIYKTGNRSPATVLLERNLVANKLKSSLAERISRDKLVDQGILKTSSPAKLNMEQSMQKAIIGRSLANRPSLDMLQAQGIMKEQGARQQTMEKNIARTMLGKRLSTRPDLQQLQNQGIYHKTSDAKNQLERSLITSQLSRALTRRPSREALEGKGILEEDEFALMFKSICDDQELLSLVLLSEWDVVKQQLNDGSLNTEILGKAFAEVDSDRDGSIDFSQFLALLELTELLQKQQTEEKEDSPAEKLRKRRQYRQRKQEQKDKGEGQLNQQSTLKASLLSKIKHRPTMDMLQAKGIIGGQSPAAQLLERNLITSTLKQKMESRRDQATLEQLGILKASSSRMEQMEHNMKKTMLGKALSKRSSKAELESQGIYMEGSSVSLGLERNVQKGMLARRLSNRPDIEQLQNQGIYQKGSVVSRNLEQGLLQRRLSSALDNRPEMDQLVNQGIYLNQTGAQIGMEQSMSKMLLNRRLSNRPDMQQLQNLGIYKPDGAGGRGADLERNLKSSMLARQLGTRLELEQLQNMGIYKEMETAPTEEDRKVIENQLNSSLNNRRSKAAMEAAGILKADTSTKSMQLERNLISSQLSRALGKSARKTHADLKLSGIIPDALAIGFKEICSEAETATLDQLKSMKGFNESLGDGGITEDQIAQIFAQADSDGDGEINFSQFMILTDQVEVVKDSQGTAGPSEEAGDSSRAALGSLLSKRIGARPSVMDMMSMGVMKKEKSPAAAMLERNLVVSQLKNNLARRQSKENLMQQGILQETSGAQREIEQEAHKTMLSRALGRRPSKENLVSQGILSTASSTQALLERNLLKNALKNQLKSRPSIQELGNQGIYQTSASDEYISSLDQVLAVSMSFECSGSELFQVASQ